LSRQNQQYILPSCAAEIVLDPLDVVKSVAPIEGLFEQVRAIGAAPRAIGGDHTAPSPICARSHERARPG